MLRGRSRWRQASRRSGFGLLLLALAGGAGACDRWVTLTGVQPGGGDVLLAVFADEASFRIQPALSLRVSATDAQLRVPACRFPAGELAITVFQDRNGNSQLDTNGLGLPQEPWGVTGRRPRLSAPTWEGSRLAPGAELRVELRP